MRKLENITYRNFMGGFLGGLLGILSFGYLASWTLPLSCIFGVIIGFWHKEIWYSIAEHIMKGINVIILICSRIKNMAVTLPGKDLELSRKFSGFLGGCLLVFHLVLFSFIWLFRRPIAFFDWMKSERKNRAIFTMIILCLAFLGINSIWFVPLSTEVHQVIIEAKSNDLEGGKVFGHIMMWLFFALMVFMSCFQYVLSRTGDTNDKSKNKKIFLEHVGRYSKLGPTRFFFIELVKIFLSTITLMFSVALLIIVYSGLAIFFLSIIVLPFRLLIGLIKGIYKVAFRTQHWLCFGTTLVVTILTVFFVQKYFLDPRILWMIAVFNGVICGMVTEGLRRLTVYFFRKNIRIAYVARTNYQKQLKPSWDMFFKIGNIFWDFYVGGFAKKCLL